MAVAAVIVENGTGIANANSYASVAQLRQYAENNGYTLPVPDDACAVLLYKAMLYIELKEASWQGVRSTTTQVLSWPRRYVKVLNALFSDDDIPVQLINAQMQLACEAASGVNLLPTVVSNGNLKKKVRGPLTDEYFAPNQMGSLAPSFPIVDGWLAMFMLYSSYTGQLRVVRA